MPSTSSTPNTVRPEWIRYSRGIATKAKANGYKFGYIKTHFPKVVYATDGTTLTVTDEEALRSATKEGFGEEFVPAPAPVPQGPGLPIDENSGIFRALMDELHDMKNQIEELYDRVEDLETARAGKPKQQPQAASAPKAS